ncbi:hypothetical protein A2713_01590 [candidate division WWE3 bacterium RIFCSPHIGHO2_01_FULL_35_17]|uniref:Uncharacterized protein n=1 Tax=candidate division WWE3 bacterium RIFCSPHIGHO2_01_FULL_35_17 TaxID=1802614 RepID=A0A1F4UPL4_UNCKA|nr:MAG: hypothetical protein A2713_01590 [candidate division WWE3 bacterium RIFCSPHIGHO2_01_FULL_35_17]
MKILKWELISALTAPAIFYYLFQFNNIYVLIAFVFGVLSSYIFLQKNSPITHYIILSGILIYFFRSDLIFLPAYLIGFNLSFLYFNFMSGKDDKASKTLEINLLNTILLSSLVFQSSIEKFRGYNKLVLQETSFTILLVILVPLAIYFLLRIVNVNKIIISIATGVIALTYFAFCYMFFKEIGVATILIPLFSGLIAGIVNLFVKNRSIIIDVNEIVLLILIPYQVSGILGVCLAFLSTFIYIAMIGLPSKKDLSIFKNTVSKLVPLLFIFASSEINENKGVITRFNLVSGYQISWIFIIFILIECSKKYVGKIKSVLIGNEIEKAIPLFISLFTIIALAIIIRLGSVEALSSLLLVLSFYLFLVGFVESKKKIKDHEPIESMAGFLSAMSFWFLTRT